MIYRCRDFARGDGSNFTSSVDQALTGCTDKREMVEELQTRKEKVLNMTDKLCAGKHCMPNMVLHVWGCTAEHFNTQKNGFL